MPVITTRAGKGSELSHNELDANFARTVRQVTTTDTVLVSDNHSVIEGNHAATPFTITLPTVADAGSEDIAGDFETTFTNINAAAVSIDGNGSETIDGGAGLYVLGQWDSVTIKLDSAATGWKVVSSSNNPAGIISMWAGATVPGGWLECDGSTVSRTTYSRIFAAIADVYGVGNGTTTFEIPDLRGQFVRGYDNGAGTDPDAASRTDSGDGSTTGDNVGTKQADAHQAHTHPTGTEVSLSGGADYTTGMLAQSSGTSTGAATGRTTTETRPTNVALMYIIKV